ncbi:hypothetical protein NQX30_04765 [Candidatus Persebacteraceae bacterium Df01]|jgi:hypothetical protein|uniref:Uncharacterized protein n=1 Tax=Candidatus Doriopsillibacter californiensis TaxID=2970740 RepID=A0ABT7QM02_9GAMM|nr:hypothetical protein [Candidatus Persebacteraceae bacterium Df01]
MDFDANVAFKFVQMGSIAAISVYLWLRRRHDRNAERIGSHDQKITQLETVVEINSRAVKKLEAESISHANNDNKMNQLLHEMKGRLEGIGNAVDLVVKHLVGDKK